MPSQYADPILALHAKKYIESSGPSSLIGRFLFSYFGSYFDICSLWILDVLRCVKPGKEWNQ